METTEITSNIDIALLERIESEVASYLTKVEVASMSLETLLTTPLEDLGLAIEDESLVVKAVAQAFFGIHLVVVFYQEPEGLIKRLVMTRNPTESISLPYPATPKDFELIRGIFSPRIKKIELDPVHTKYYSHHYGGKDLKTLLGPADPLHPYVRHRTIIK